MGEFLMNAQGEDVVAGIRNTEPLAALETQDPAAYKELRAIMRKLETHYQDLCDIEFTIQQGKLWMLQTRAGKRTAKAAMRIAVDMALERLISEDEAVARIEKSTLRKMVITDSIRASEAAQNCKKIRYLSIAPLLGEAIRRIADETSVSSLFD